MLSSSKSHTDIYRIFLTYLLDDTKNTKTAYYNNIHIYLK